MRNLIILLITALTITGCCTAKIDIDFFKPDGQHLIKSSSKKFHVENLLCDFSLMVYENGIDTIWYLNVSHLDSISFSSELLMRLETNEILKLSSSDIMVKRITQPGVIFTRGSMFSSGNSFGFFNGYNIGLNSFFHSIFSSTSYILPWKERNYYSSLFVIDENQLAMIRWFKLKKIRVIHDLNYYDQVFLNDNFSDFLSDCHYVIQKRLKHPKKSRNVYDNF